MYRQEKEILLSITYPGFIVVGNNKHDHIRYSETISEF